MQNLPTVVGNKFTSYLLYAIGEIILVVIGILIAVSLNNWNQNLKDQEAERALLKKVMEDLELDTEVFQKNIETCNRIQTFHHNCFTIILGEKKPSEATISDPNLLRRTMYYLPLTRENYPDLVSQLKTEEIKEAVSTYYRWLNTMDESYEEFEQVVVQIRKTISQKDGHNLAALYKVKDVAFNADGRIRLITEESLFQLIQDKYMQQLLVESSLKLQDAHGSLDSLLSSNMILKSKINSYLTNEPDGLL